MDNQLNHFFFLSSGDERKVGASKKVGGGCRLQHVKPAFKFKSTTTKYELNCNMAF